ncbi:MAG: hypothetical protein IH901_08025 [Proteobacteria bacterium]|nr:hypothetical protein [Pseudomonadota bacterium]
MREGKIVEDSETDFTAIEPIIQMAVVTSGNKEAGPFFIHCLLNLGEGKGLTFDIVQRDLTKDEAHDLIAHAFAILKTGLENKGEDILKNSAAGVRH